MINKRLFYGAALALLFVGAGCSANQSINGNINDEPGYENDGNPSNNSSSADDLKIDASVKALLDASSAENSEQSGEEQTAGRVDDDEAEINAYGQAQYEAK